MSRNDDATALRMIPYVRKSRKSDESSFSLDEQRKMIESRAKAEGFELLPLISEDGVSGSKSWRDRELGKAIAACADGRADGIVVAYQDRLARENSIRMSWAQSRARIAPARRRLVCAQGRSVGVKRSPGRSC